MFGAFLYRDFAVLRYRGRSLLWMIAAIGAVIGMLSLLDSRVDTTGVVVFGRDFLRLLLLSIIGMSGFMEHYSDALERDRRQGILAAYLLSGRSATKYFIVKSLVPLTVGLGGALVTLCGYLFLLQPAQFMAANVGGFAVVMASQLFLLMGLGMLLNILESSQGRSSAGAAGPVILVNGIVLYFVNPVRHFIEFNLLTVSLGGLAYIACHIAIRSRFRSNLCREF